MDDKNTGLENQGDLGNVKIDKMIEKYGAGKQSKGLAALLKIGDPVEAAPAPSHDPMVMNEILRIVRERDNYIEDRFDGLENQLRLTRKFHDKDKRLLVSLVSATLVIGLLLGNLLTAPDKVDKPIVVNNIQSPQVATKTKVTAINQMVTKKFVNMRIKNSPKSKKLLTISPAQVVDVIGRKGGWVNIKYHNNLTGKVYKGFVWDEYLTGLK